MTTSRDRVGESDIANNTRYAMGIDFGSLTAKTVILDEDRRVVAACVVQKGVVSEEGVQASIAGALDAAGLDTSDITCAVSTGYGRRRLEIANRTITEITCHARGASHLYPQCRLLIDIGGQDSKVIALDEMGLVSQFAMNDRCAAGTGQFLEVLARALVIDLDQIGMVAAQAASNLTISSTCTVFAETEVISLMAEGHTKADIIAGVNDAISRRTLGLVQRVGLRRPVVMTGGVAKNIGVVRALEQTLGVSLLIPDDPQVVGALGAALFALDDLRRGGT